MTKTPCLSNNEISRVVLEPGTEQTREHLKHCKRCREKKLSQQRISDLGAQLPLATLSAEKTDSAFLAIRYQLQHSPVDNIEGKYMGRKYSILAAAALLTVALGGGGIMWFIDFNPSAEKSNGATADALYRGTVHGSADADYEIVSTQPDEIVRMFNGTITVKVEHLHNNERFRVFTGDSEIEVMGTTFDVVVKDDSLLAVRVLSGLVTVRRDGYSEFQLAKGETWRNQKEKESTPKLAGSQGLPQSFTSEQDSAEHRKNSKGNLKTGDITAMAGAKKIEPQQSARKPKAVHKKSAEMNFNDGWKQLKQKQYAEAAASFEAVVKNSKGPLLEDAVYWLGVSLERDNRTGEARRVLNRYLKSYPNGARKLDVSRRLRELEKKAGTPRP